MAGEPTKESALWAFEAATAVGHDLARWAATRDDLSAADRSALAVAAVGTGTLSKLGELLLAVGATMPCCLHVTQTAIKLRAPARDINSCLQPRFVHLPKPVIPLGSVELFRPMVLVYPITQDRPQLGSQLLARGARMPELPDDQPVFFVDQTEWFRPGLEAELLACHMVRGNGHVIFGQRMHPTSNLSAIPWVGTALSWLDPKDPAPRVRGCRHARNGRIVARAEHPALDTVRIAYALPGVPVAVGTLRTFILAVLNMDFSLGTTEALWLAADTLAMDAAPAVSNPATRALANAFVAALWVHLDNFADQGVTWIRVPDWVTPDKLDVYVESIVTTADARAVLQEQRRVAADVPVEPAEPVWDDTPPVRRPEPEPKPEPMPEGIDPRVLPALTDLQPGQAVAFLMEHDAPAGIMLAVRWLATKNGSQPIRAPHYSVREEGALAELALADGGWLILDDAGMFRAPTMAAIQAAPVRARVVLTLTEVSAKLVAPENMAEWFNAKLIDLRQPPVSEPLPTPTTKVYPWIAPLLPKAAVALGVTIDPKPLGGGWNGQVFATDDGRVVKITASAEEVRAIQVLVPTTAGRELIPRIDHIAHLGPSGRDPDVQGDPTDAYAILREAVTPVKPEPGSEGPPIAYDKIPSADMDPSTRLLNDKRLNGKGFMRAIREERLQVASAWMTDLGFLLAWCRRLNLSDEIPRVRAKWRAAAWHASRKDLRALSTIGNYSRGAFVDVATTQLGRTADGRVVLFDLGFVDAVPDPIHSLVGDVGAWWSTPKSKPAPTSTPTPEPASEPERVLPTTVATPEGPVEITLGAKGKRSDWHNIQLGKTRYGWNGERWARKEVPSDAVLRAVAQAGYTEFPAPRMTAAEIQGLHETTDPTVLGLLPFYALLDKTLASAAGIPVKFRTRAPPVVLEAVVYADRADMDANQHRAASTLSGDVRPLFDVAEDPNTRKPGRVWDIYVSRGLRWDLDEDGQSVGPPLDQELLGNVELTIPAVVEQSQPVAKPTPVQAQAAQSVQSQPPLVTALEQAVQATLNKTGAADAKLALMEVWEALKATAAEHGLSASFSPNRVPVVWGDRGWGTSVSVSKMDGPVGYQLAEVDVREDPALAAQGAGHRYAVTIRAWIADEATTRKFAFDVLPTTASHTTLVLDEPPTPTEPISPALAAAIQRILAQPSSMAPVEAVQAYLQRPILRGPVNPTVRFMPTIRDALVAGGHRAEAVDLAALRRDLGDIATGLTADDQLWLDSPWILGMLGIRSYLRTFDAAAGVRGSEWGWAAPYLILDELLALGRSPFEVLSFHNTFLVGPLFSSSDRYSSWPGHEWSYSARWLTISLMRQATRHIQWEPGDKDNLPRPDAVLYPTNPAYQWWLFGRPAQPAPALPLTPAAPDLAGRQIRTEAALAAEVTKIIDTWGLSDALPGPHKAGWDEYTVKVSIRQFEVEASRGRGNAISRVVPGLLRDVSAAIPAIGMLVSLGLSGSKSDSWTIRLVRDLASRYQLGADGAE